MRQIMTNCQCKYSGSVLVFPFDPEQQHAFRRKGPLHCFSATSYEVKEFIIIALFSQHRQYTHTCSLCSVYTHIFGSKVVFFSPATLMSYSVCEMVRVRETGIEQERQGGVETKQGRERKKNRMCVGMCGLFSAQRTSSG